ncbi:putative metalloprotease CJM1_0395 family protein [Thermosulfuriphilus sp.]
MKSVGLLSGQNIHVKVRPTLEPAQKEAPASQDPATRKTSNKSPFLRPGLNFAKGKDGKPLSPQEIQELQRLKQIDAQVRAHERAHMVVGGQYVRGGPHYKYRTGPDGQKYAVGGEVSIDTSPVPGNPRATVAKMKQVKRAALAPAHPSAQDYRVAAKAGHKEAQARQEILEEILKEKQLLQEGREKGPYPSSRPAKSSSSATRPGELISLLV